MVGSMGPRCETVRGVHWPKKGREVVWNARRGNHLGQRSRTASTGRTYGCKRSDQTLKNSCGTGAVHIWVPAFAGTTDSRSRLLERHVDLAALLKPLRHRQVLGAHEIRIEQFRLIAVSGIAEHGHDGMTRS